MQIQYTSDLCGHLQKNETALHQVGRLSCQTTWRVLKPEPRR